MTTSQAFSFQTGKLKTQAPNFSIMLRVLTLVYERLKVLKK